MGSWVSENIQSWFAVLGYWLYVIYGLGAGLPLGLLGKSLAKRLMAKFRGDSLPIRELAQALLDKLEAVEQWSLNRGSSDQLLTGEIRFYGSKLVIDLDEYYRDKWLRMDEQNASHLFNRKETKSIREKADKIHDKLFLQDTESKDLYLTTGISNTLKGQGTTSRNSRHVVIDTTKDQ